MLISKIACNILMLHNLKNKDKKVLQREQYCKGHTALCKEAQRIKIKLLVQLKDCAIIIICCFKTFLLKT